MKLDLKDIDYNLIKKLNNIAYNFTEKTSIHNKIIYHYF